jgi:hypothetical protein
MPKIPIFVYFGGPWNEYFTAIWNILRLSATYIPWPFGHFEAIWNVMYQEKSGNPYP